MSQNPNFSIPNYHLKVQSGAVKPLAAAILYQAIRDYMIAVRDGDTHETHELRKWFNSGWANMLCPDAMDLNVLVDKADEGATLFVKKAKACAKPEIHPDSPVKVFGCPICHEWVRMSWKTLARGPSGWKHFGWEWKCSSCKFKYEERVKYERDQTISNAG